MSNTMSPADVTQAVPNEIKRNCARGVVWLWLRNNYPGNPGSGPVLDEFIAVAISDMLVDRDFEPVIEV